MNCMLIDKKIYDDLVKHNQRLKDVINQNKILQAELDKEIKNNRKLVKALKEYAHKGNWGDYFGDCDGMFWDCGDKGFETAQQVLKEIEEV